MFHVEHGSLLRGRPRWCAAIAHVVWLCSNVCPPTASDQDLSSPVDSNVEAVWGTRELPSCQGSCPPSLDGRCATPWGREMLSSDAKPERGPVSRSGATLHDLLQSSDSLGRAHGGEAPRPLMQQQVVFHVKQMSPGGCSSHALRFAVTSLPRSIAKPWPQ